MTADEVAEVHGHHTVCEELRKHMHGDHRPLSKVCTHVDCAYVTSVVCQQKHYCIIKVLQGYMHAESLPCKAEPGHY